MDVLWFPPASCNLHSAVSSSFVLRRAMPPTDMRLEAPEEELDAGTIGIGKLNDDLMHAIFTTWDAFSLATVRSVCKHWRVIAASEDLWACACRARWALRRRSNRRPYISQLQSRPASWLQAYRIYHHLRRPPAMQDRAVYADGLCGRVGAWLQVKHHQACALPLASADATQPPNQQPAQHRVLRASVLVQNVQSEATVCSIPSNEEELRSRVFDLVNRERTSRALDPLTFDPALNVMAEDYCCEMIEGGSAAEQAAALLGKLREENVI